MFFGRIPAKNILWDIFFNMRKNFTKQYFFLG